MAACDTALAAEPGHAETLHRKGMALSRLGRHADAADALREAIAADPGNARYQNNAGLVLREIRRHAQALACFEAESIAEYERRRAEFKARRDFFIPALQSLGLNVPVMPDGAFYAWADCTQAAQHLGVSGSWDFAFELMRRAHLAVTPGRDFGTAGERPWHGSVTAWAWDGRGHGMGTAWACLK